MSRVLALGLLLLVALTAGGCHQEAEASSPATDLTPAVKTAGESAFRPIPLATGTPSAKVALGRKLFHEPRLSRDASVSCASCHDLRKGGTDRRARSLGVDGHEGDRNAPTIYNSVFNFRQFWDGRARTLVDQIEGPVTNPKEMNADWPEVVDRLRADADYTESFAQAYPDGVSRENIKDALAAFESTLTTPNSRFDRHLRGDAQALTPTERKGFQVFQDYGCVSCHQGINLGGNMYQTMGVMANVSPEHRPGGSKDQGRYHVTGAEKDRYRFRVPSLRNVAATAPYFHDGSVAELDEAVALMARYQLGRSLSKEEQRELVAFLGTLTGEYEGESL